MNSCCAWFRKREAHGNWCKKEKSGTTFFFKTKIMVQRFGNLKNSLYLCNVRMSSEGANNLLSEQNSSWTFLTIIWGHSLQGYVLSFSLMVYSGFLWPIVSRCSLIRIYMSSKQCNKTLAMRILSSNSVWSACMLISLHAMASSIVALDCFSLFKKNAEIAKRPPQVTQSQGTPLYKGTSVGYLLFKDLTQRYPRPNPLF